MSALYSNEPELTAYGHIYLAKTGHLKVLREQMGSGGASDSC